MDLSHSMCSVLFESLKWIRVEVCSMSMNRRSLSDSILCYWALWWCCLKEAGMRHQGSVKALPWLSHISPQMNAQRAPQQSTIKRKWFCEHHHLFMLTAFTSFLTFLNNLDAVNSAWPCTWVADFMGGQFHKKTFRNVCVFMRDLSSSCWYLALCLIYVLYHDAELHNRSVWVVNLVAGKNWFW